MFFRVYISRFKRAAFASLKVLPLALMSCQAKIPEGRFLCDTDSDCPSLWTCAQDKRCYSSDDESMIIGGASSSGGNDSSGDGLIELAGCSSAETCETGSCLKGLYASADSGYCSEGCSTLADCQGLFTTPAVCGWGACVPACGSSAGCESPQQCLAIEDGVTMGRFGCFEPASDALLGINSCTPLEPSTCATPAACLAQLAIDSAGVCSVRCQLGDACPGFARCVRAIAGPDETVGHCFHRCDNKTICGEGLTCDSLDGGTDICVPPGWIGKNIPLPAPPMQ